MFKNASKNVCTSTVLVPPDLLSPAPPTSSATKMPGNREGDHDDPEPTDKGDIHMEYSYD
jgi:hypothetical protein